MTQGTKRERMQDMPNETNKPATTTTIGTSRRNDADELPRAPARPGVNETPSLSSTGPKPPATGETKGDEPKAAEGPPAFNGETKVQRRRRENAERTKAEEGKNTTPAPVKVKPAK